MINRLFTTLKCSGTLTIVLFAVRAFPANSTEYVFSAPPEVDNEVIEIREQAEDYPFYECDREISDPEAKEKSEDTEAEIDSHDCDDLLENEYKQDKLSSRNK
ncbi:hypothetical protein I4641_05375 [Waterburya agarophytonicola K14]|uniref:Secreted protein n=1 Tax=Waterburya agarophytonicola KI4 TaxID=2874699 RepID=A0A964BPD6_9CYAN|nr:hypothetical protein [Waterburya agarophytonicola]MCC0176407.1 hypothetical protein [Waterburya agarophytonicola KI4]